MRGIVSKLEEMALNAGLLPNTSNTITNALSDTARALSVSNAKNSIIADQHAMIRTLQNELEWAVRERQIAMFLLESTLRDENLTPYAIQFLKNRQPVA